MPRWWALAVIVTATLARMYDSRQLPKSERIGAELGTYVGARDRSAAEQEARLIKFTVILTWLTGAVLVAATATIVATLST